MLCNEKSHSFNSAFFNDLLNNWETPCFVILNNKSLSSIFCSLMCFFNFLINWLDTPNDLAFPPRIFDSPFLALDFVTLKVTALLSHVKSLGFKCNTSSILPPVCNKVSKRILLLSLTQERKLIHSFGKKYRCRSFLTVYFIPFDLIPSKSPSFSETGFKDKRVFLISI